MLHSSIAHSIICTRPFRRKMHSDWFSGIEILQGRRQHGEKAGYCYPSGLEKTLCKWGIYVPLVMKGLIDSETYLYDHLSVSMANFLEHIFITCTEVQCKEKVNTWLRNSALSEQWRFQIFTDHAKHVRVHAQKLWEKKNQIFQLQDSSWGYPEVILGHSGWNFGRMKCNL